MTIVVQDFEFQYTDTGILFNNDFTPGETVVDIKSVQGLDQADYKSYAKSFDGMDGGLIKIDGREMRQIVITGDIIGGTDPIEPFLDDLKALFAPVNTNRPLYFRAPGIDTRQVFCKSLGFKYSWDLARRLNCTPFSVSFTAEDPVVYGAVEKTATLATAPPAPGHTFNHGFNYSFGGSAAPGGTVVVNEGNLAVGFLVEVVGQSTSNLSVVSLTAQDYVNLSMMSGSDEVLIIDFYNQNVTLDGANRRNKVYNEGWFKLLPGENHLLVLDALGQTVTTMVKYYDGFE